MFTLDSFLGAGEYIRKYNKSYLRFINLYNFIKFHH